MRHTSKFVLSATVATALLLHLPADAQTMGAEIKGADVLASAADEEGASAVGCPRPEGTKEAKVIDFDISNSTARLAVNLEAGRFTLVTIKTWDRPDDPRPLNPVIEAAKIMQGKLQIFSRKLTTDPASAPDEFLIMTEMGGGYVCWAKPSSMLQPPSAPVADVPPASKPVAPAAVITPASAPGANTATTPASGPSPTDAVTRARRALDRVREASPQ